MFSSASQRDHWPIKLKCFYPRFKSLKTDAEVPHTFLQWQCQEAQSHLYMPTCLRASSAPAQLQGLKSPWVWLLISSQAQGIQQSWLINRQLTQAQWDPLLCNFLITFPLICAIIKIKRVSPAELCWYAKELHSFPSFRGKPQESFPVRTISFPYQSSLLLWYIPGHRCQVKAWAWWTKVENTRQICRGQENISKSLWNWSSTFEGKTQLSLNPVVKLSELTTFKEIISKFLVLADLGLILLLLIFNSSTIRTLLERRKKKEKNPTLKLMVAFVAWQKYCKVLSFLRGLFFWCRVQVQEVSETVRLK